MEAVRVKSEQLESGMIGLLCFLAVSARGLVDEPKVYGPMRLIEAAQRLVEMAESSGIHHDLFTDVVQRIEAFPLDALPEGEEEFVEFMDELVVLLATWVGQSYVTPENNLVGD